MSDIIPFVTNWLYVAGGIISIIVPLLAGLRWLIKAYLRELVPNGGHSIKDQVNRLERQVEMLVEHLITNK